MFLFWALTIMPGTPGAVDVKESWTSGPWIPQNLQAWGNNKLAVDYGPNGLWNYDGKWIRLSVCDPQSLQAWGGDKLAVDFGSHGLWTYDGETWSKLSQWDL